MLKSEHKSCKQTVFYKLYYKIISYFVIFVEKVRENVDQGRCEKLSLTNMSHLKNIFVLIQLEV